MQSRVSGSLTLAIAVVALAAVLAPPPASAAPRADALPPEHTTEDDASALKPGGERRPRPPWRTP